MSTCQGGDWITVFSSKVKRDVHMHVSWDSKVSECPPKMRLVIERMGVISCKQNKASQPTFQVPSPQLLPSCRCSFHSQQINTACIPPNLTRLQDPPQPVAALQKANTVLAFLHSGRASKTAPTALSPVLFTCLPYHRALDHSWLSFACQQKCSP